MPIEAKIQYDGRYCIVHFERWQPDGRFAVCHPTEQPDHPIDVAREDVISICDPFVGWQQVQALLPSVQ